MPIRRRAWPFLMRIAGQVPIPGIESAVRARQRLASPVSWQSPIRVARSPGAPTLDGASQTLAALYAAPDGFNDVTTGSNGATAAARGYDEVSGLGSPASGYACAIPGAI